MKVLHLCSYYIGSRVYKNLCEQLTREDQSCTQSIWVPVRSRRQRGLNCSSEPGIHTVYSKCLSLLTRLSFFYKQVRMFYCFHRQPQCMRMLDDCSVIHAHTLYSDGFLAYWLSRKYQLPYVLSVRTTDVSLFERYLPHWRFMTRRVISNSRCLIFISPAHKAQMEVKYADCMPKTLLLPNGLDDYWICNALTRAVHTAAVARRGIYIGEINSNKNIKRCILAFFQASQHAEARFTVLGGDYSAFRAIYGELPESLQSKVDFIPRTQDKQRIRDLLRQSQILIMPSFMETFGLAYLEAISQCVPVVYSRGQGIDGLYPEGTLGFSCDPASQASIAMAIGQVLERFPQGLSFEEGKNPVHEYSWQARAKVLLSQVY